MVLETSVLSIFNQLTQLEARENFINMMVPSKYEHSLQAKQISTFQDKSCPCTVYLVRLCSEMITFMIDCDHFLLIYNC
jgi:hypothetical protein